MSIYKFNTREIKKFHKHMSKELICVMQETVLFF